MLLERMNPEYLATLKAAAKSPNHRMNKIAKGLIESLKQEEFYTELRVSEGINLNIIFDECQNEFDMGFLARYFN